MHQSDDLRSIGRCALVADDDATMRNVLRSLLSEQGYTVLLASSGREALKLAAGLDAASGLEATIAIVDLSMPDGNGLETCVALRNIENWREVPILVLTHYHTEKAIIAARRAGASGFVGKPFVPMELFRQIVHLTRKRSDGKEAFPTNGINPHLPAHSEEIEEKLSPIRLVELVDRHANKASLDQQQAVLNVYRNVAVDSTGSVSSTVKCEARPRILLGDSSGHAREVLSGLLETEGYEVESADDGQKLLSMFIGGHYDLVLMTVRLSVMGGAEVAYAIRQIGGAKGTTPIIALAETIGHLLLRELKSAGINECLMKTVALQDLLNCLRAHLSEKATERLSAHQMMSAPNSDALSKVATFFPPGAMIGFLSNLVVAVEETLSMLDDGWIVADATELSRRLHSLAGTAGTLGCRALSACARELEADRSRQYQFIGVARATLRAIQAYITLAKHI